MSGSNTMKMPRTITALPAFSLIEALVVIACLIILALFVSPALSRLFQVSERAKCAANLRQMGMAIFNYAGEHEGLLPGPTYGSQHASYTAGEVNQPRPPLQQRPLIALIAPYLNLPLHPQTPHFPEVAACPAARKMVLKSDGSLTRDNAQYYSTHETLTTGSTGQRPFGYNTSTTTVPIPPMKLVNIKQPQLIVGLMDKEFETHEGSVNVLFMDGRVQPLNRRQISYPNSPNKSRLRVVP